MHIRFGNLQWITLSYPPPDPKEVAPPHFQVDMSRFYQLKIINQSKKSKCNFFFLFKPIDQRDMSQCAHFRMLAKQLRFPDTNSRNFKNFAFGKHTMENLNACLDCGKLYKSASDLRKHLIDIHANVWEFEIGSKDYYCTLSLLNPILRNYSAATTEWKIPMSKLYLRVQSIENPKESPQEQT